jgi:hypothetical protein
LELTLFKPANTGIRRYYKKTPQYAGAFVLSFVKDYLSFVNGIFEYSQ